MWRRLGLCLLAALIVTTARAAPASESEVKAVFLFNFTQFVTWPESAFASPDAPFVIGIVGHDPFGNALDAAVRGERVGSRPLAVRRYKNVPDLGDCQILFIDRSETNRLAEILAAVRSRSTLTVSDGDRVAERGVMINFATDNNRLHLIINLGEAEARGLTLSSKLLRPSQIVKTEGR